MVIEVRGARRERERLRRFICIRMLLIGVLRTVRKDDEGVREQCIRGEQRGRFSGGLIGVSFGSTCSRSDEKGWVNMQSSGEYGFHGATRRSWDDR